MPRVKGWRGGEGGARGRGLERKKEGKKITKRLLPVVCYLEMQNKKNTNKYKHTSEKKTKKNKQKTKTKRVRWKGSPVSLCDPHAATRCWLTKKKTKHERLANGMGVVKKSKKYFEKKTRCKGNSVKSNQRGHHLENFPSFRLVVKKN